MKKLFSKLFLILSISLCTTNQTHSFFDFLGNNSSLLSVLIISIASTISLSYQAAKLEDNQNKNPWYIFSALSATIGFFALAIGIEKKLKKIKRKEDKSNKNTTTINTENYEEFNQKSLELSNNSLNNVWITEIKNCKMGYIKNNNLNSRIRIVLEKNFTKPKISNDLFKEVKSPKEYTNSFKIEKEQGPFTKNINGITCEVTKESLGFNEMLIIYVEEEKDLDQITQKYPTPQALIEKCKDENFEYDKIYHIAFLTTEGSNFEMKNWSNFSYNEYLKNKKSN